jgi:hypothetical protein
LLARGQRRRAVIDSEGKKRHVSKMMKTKKPRKTGDDYIRGLIRYQESEDRDQIGERRLRRR